MANERAAIVRGEITCQETLAQKLEALSARHQAVEVLNFLLSQNTLLSLTNVIHCEFCQDIFGDFFRKKLRNCCCIEIFGGATYLQWMGSIFVGACAGGTSKLV